MKSNAKFQPAGPRLITEAASPEIMRHAHDKLRLLAAALAGKTAYKVGSTLAKIKSTGEIVAVIALVADDGTTAPLFFSSKVPLSEWADPCDIDGTVD